MLLLTTDTDAIEAAEKQQAINAEAIAAYRPAKPKRDQWYGVEKRLYQLRVTEVKCAYYQTFAFGLMKGRQFDCAEFVKVTRPIIEAIAAKDTNPDSKICVEAYYQFESEIRKELTP